MPSLSGTTLGNITFVDVLPGRSVAGAQKAEMFQCVAPAWLHGCFHGGSFYAVHGHMRSRLLTIALLLVIDFRAQWTSRLASACFADQVQSVRQETQKDKTKIKARH